MMNRLGLQVKNGCLLEMALMVKLCGSIFGISVYRPKDLIICVLGWAGLHMITLRKDANAANDPCTE